MSSTKPIFSMPLTPKQPVGHKAGVQSLEDEINRVVDQLWPQSPGGPAGVLDEVNAARSGAESARDAAEGFRDAAEGFRDEAEAARDTAFVNADVYPDIATGRAAVSNGQQFQVVDGDEIIRYRRDSSSTQTEVARYPAGHVVSQLIADHGSHAAVIGQTVREVERLGGDVTDVRVAMDQLDDRQNDGIALAAGTTSLLATTIGQMSRQLDRTPALIDAAVFSFLLPGSNAFVDDDTAYVPEPSEIVMLDFETAASLPTSKGTMISGVHTLTVGGTTVKCHGTIEVQGSGSAPLPKKNWKLRFFSDEALSQKLRLQVGKSVSSTSWVYKCDWRDPSMTRSYVCFAVWRQMVEARAGLPKFEVDNAWWGATEIKGGTMSGATGIPNTHPMAMTINGEFYGLGYLMLKDEPRNYNLDPDNPDHVYFELDSIKAPTGGAYPVARSWEKLSSVAIDADTENKIGDWILWEFPKWSSMSAGQKTQVKTMIDDLNDVLFTSQQYFNDNFTSYFDQANLIDFMLFVELIHDWDHLSRDIQIVSYDMKKVYFLPWDKDTTFGVKSENELISPSSNLLSLNSHNVSQTPFYRIYTYDPSAVEARYAQLRETGIFSAENIYHLIEQCSRMISPEMWKKEYAKWSRIGDGDERHGIFEQSSFQMIDWTEQRVAHLDTKYNYAA